MATIRSGASNDEWTIDSTSKAGRVTLYTAAGAVAMPTVDATAGAERVTIYDTAGNALFSQTKTTYMASATFTPAATPTDIVTINGSGTKTIRVYSFKITTTNTAAGSQQFFLIKRSAADTTGTFVAGTAVPLDSSNAAATATVGHYTANPGALGAAVGTIVTARVASPVATPASFAGVAFDAGIDLLASLDVSIFPQIVTLRGTAQGLCLNFNGAALVAGQTHAWQIMWTEE